MFSAPTAYQTAYQQPTGTRFGGDALYNGENRKRGRVVSFYINAPEKKKEKLKFCTFFSREEYLCYDEMLR